MSTWEENMLIDDRAVDVLCCVSVLDPVEPDRRVMDRFRAMISDCFLV
jgi:hypothetical protein